MPRAIWNKQVIAEAAANEIHRVEGNVYFPLSAVKREFLQSSDTHTHCVWKGMASYYDVVVGVRRTKMRPGFIPNRQRWPTVLKTTWHFGAV